MASLYSLEGDALDGKGKGSVVSFKGMVSGLVKENGYTLCLTSGISGGIDKTRITNFNSLAQDQKLLAAAQTLSLSGCYNTTRTMTWGTLLAR